MSAIVSIDLLVKPVLTRAEAEQVAQVARDEAKRLIDARRKPVFEYEVFYQGHEEDARYVGSDGTQRRLIKATDHYAALIQAASASQHSTGACYFVVGRDESRKSLGDNDFNTRTVQRFKLTNLGEQEPRDYDFMVPGNSDHDGAYFVPTQYYKVEQVF